MAISAEHMAIVQAIINLANALRIYVVAEGVETEEQAARLHALGCHEAQGFLFSSPVRAEDVDSLLPRLVDSDGPASSAPANGRRRIDQAGRGS
jgi:EAL domain-containing protein (putative c-di-GMP-specific phosphodiesterase class I)